MSRAATILSIRFQRVSLSLGVGILFTVGFAASAHAADYANLAVVKPVMTCDQLAKADVKTPDGTKITINSAKVRDTDKGPYCRVTGSLEPHLSFQGDLPLNNWTQRFLEGAQGREGVERAGGCMPALNGEIAVVTGDREIFDADPAAGDWGVGPQARINTAYLGQHMTAVAFKSVIKTFYGQGPKFSYMAGCSGGGMQTLKEAERYPEDFNGYTIGAPPFYQTTHDVGLWHGWEYHVNQRADGSIILAKEKLPILHEAAIQHCAVAAGLLDNDLQQPTACKFDKSWVQCPAAASDTSKCLTAEEANVAEQLYLGPNDGKGNFFEMSGYPLGSEMNWHLSTQGKPSSGEGVSPHGIHSFIMPPLSGKPTAEIMATFGFNMEWFDKTRPMWPLFNAGDTNLKPLAKLGDKIILWNGAEDNTVEPAGTIAYYEAVQKEVGVKETDSFMRFFMLPGVGHCGGGDSANQIDTLTPLMAWVETGKAPAVLVAGKPVPQTGGPGGGGQGGPGAPGAIPNYPPYALPDKPTVYTRPVYPFPNIAKYKGTGDPNDAANYVEAKGPLKVPQTFNSLGYQLMGPDNLKFYKVENGNLVEVPKK